MHSIPEKLEEEGFAIVDGVLSADMIESLIDRIEIHINSQTDPANYAMRNLLQTIPAVQRIAESLTVRTLVESVLGQGAIVVRSLFFDKTPEANWKVAWHQDLTIAVREKVEVPGFVAWSMKDGVVHVQPPTAVLERMLTVRLHLDDCDSTNGPLQVIPGSHKTGRLNAQEISALRTRNQASLCAVPRGGALLMRPLLLHASSPAAAPKHRRVVHLEFAVEPLPGRLRWL